MVKQGETDFVATCFRDLSWGRQEFYSVGWREMTGNRGLCHPKSIPLLTKHPKQPWFSAGCIHYGVTRGLFLRGRWHESCLRAWDSILMSGWWITYICASLIVELPSFLLAKSTFFGCWNPHRWCPWKCSNHGRLQPIREHVPFPHLWPRAIVLRVVGAKFQLGRETLWDTMIVIWEMYQNPVTPAYHILNSRSWCYTYILYM